MRAQVLALYKPATKVWSGFAPDFLKLLSNDLGFAYNIVHAAQFCTREQVEAYRAFLRNPWGATCEQFPRVSIHDPACCLAAANNYTSDTFLFSFDETVDLRIPEVAARNPFALKFDNRSKLAELRYVEGFPMVYKTGPNAGQELRVHMLLWGGFGEHVRSTPPIAASNAYEEAIAGSALPLTPMYTESVEALMYTTRSEDMWRLFAPFEWKLWVAIVGMVSADGPPSPPYCGTDQRGADRRHVQPAPPAPGSPGGPSASRSVLLVCEISERNE
jgi:hypothetical protein